MADAQPTPPPAAPPRKALRRRAFRFRDNVGLVLLALAATAIVWAIARQSVVKEQLPIEGVPVRWTRPRGSDLLVVFKDNNPTVTITLTCSQPEYESLRSTLQQDGVRLVIAPLSLEANSRLLYSERGDRLELPFDDALLAGLGLTPPAGSVIRVKSQTVSFSNPEFPPGFAERGIGIEILGIQPPNYRLDDVPEGLAVSAIKPDPLKAADLPTEAEMAFDTPFTRELTFDTWTTGVDGAPDAERKEVVHAFADGVLVKLKFVRIAKREFTGMLVWGLSVYDRDTYTFTLKERGTLGAPNDDRLLGELVGTQADLDWIEGAGKGLWQFTIVILDSERAKFPTAEQTETRVEGLLLWTHTDDPHFDRVHFRRTEPQKRDVFITVKRRQ